MKPPTFRQIAKACGVSVSTVSRAFNCHPNIPAKTRERIEAKARAMGWKPNPMASAYMAHLRSTQEPHHQANLAFLVAFREGLRFADLPGYHREVFQGAKTRAEALGYALDTIFLSSVDFDLSRLAAVLKNRGILGLIVHGGEAGASAFDGFDWDSFAVATWGFSLTQPLLHRAAHHMEAGMQEAMSRLRTAGYQRIALAISKNLDYLQNHAALAYYLRDQHEQGAPMLTKLYDEHPGASRELKAWLRETKPDVVIGDHVTWTAWQELPAKAKRPAFASINWHQNFPEIGGISHQPQRIGSNVLDLLVGQLLRNERGVPESPKLLLSEGRWQDGASVPERN
ncbi:MAG: LacI family DNA-binding transcriptional regulator [Verrucomicrobiota bacterium]